jgi:hypothetical protein
MTTIYLFKRDKVTGHKRIFATAEEPRKAREYCEYHNRNPNNKQWYEFTADKEYAQ